MIIALLAATVLMADSTTAMQTAPATNGAQSQATAATTEQNAKPKKQANALVCKNEPVLGSRMPTKRCRTTAQMAEQQQDDQANLDKLQRMPLDGR